MPGDPSIIRTLYTIGHSNHELGRFFELLAMHGINVIGDVRSQPYSQYASQFNRETLEAAAKVRGIRYVFLGTELGARRAEAECYVDGQAKYERVAKLPLFLQGLERVRLGMESHKLALMCSEKDPITCHRTILVCRNLRGPGVQIRHVLEDGSIEAHERAEDRLLELVGLPPGDLFQSREQLVEQAYERQGEEIAYRAGEE